MPPRIARKVERFFNAYPLKSYDKGQFLVLADEDPKHIFYLLKGQVREYDISHRGDEVVVNVFKPPAFFPMSWAINKTPNRYFFEAATSVTVRLADPDQAVEFLKANPDVMFDLLSRLCIGTDGLLRRTAHLMGGSAKSRLLFELITECRRFGERRSDGSYLITMNESEIGARAGLSRETVSREIRELKKLNLIAVSRRGILLTDINALEKKLGHDL